MNDLNFDLERYNQLIGTKTNIHKVSFFNKNIDLKKSKILILDFEFSMNKHIYELGAILIENTKIKELIFNEYKIPYNEPIWDFNLNKFTKNNNLNKDKNFFDKEYIIDLTKII